MAALAVASPAAGQGLSPGDQILLDDLRMRQQAAERRAIDQANQLMALEARLQAERSIQDLRSQALPPQLPERLSQPPQGPASPSAVAVQFPAIPDAALAESNRRVREAGRRR